MHKIQLITFLENESNFLVKTAGLFEEVVHKKKRNGTVSLIILSHALFCTEHGKAEVFHLEIITLLSSLFTPR